MPKIKNDEMFWDVPSSLQLCQSSYKLVQIPKLITIALFPIQKTFTSFS